MPSARESELMLVQSAKYVLNFRAPKVSSRTASLPRSPAADGDTQSTDQMQVELR